jgi:Protein of unknown function (DUF559)
MYVRLRELAARQADIVAAWQLVAIGWTRERIRHQIARGWRLVHPGVYALSYGPLTQRQLWIAATLTAPETFLSHASAAACYGIRPFRARYETVTRRGTGGPRRHSRVLVLRSKTLGGNTTRHDGIPITTPERVVIDLAPHLNRKDTTRLVREALRLGLTNTARMTSALNRHPNHRGTRFVRELSKRYSSLPISRTRSDAEALALEILQKAGAELPGVNVRVAGEEADLVWMRRREIIEIDGPQFHRVRDEDARKQRKWEAIGFKVRRISSDAVYDEPGLLVEKVRAFDALP